MDITAGILFINVSTYIFPIPDGQLDEIGMIWSAVRNKIEKTGSFKHEICIKK